jgi:hypothetical protein
VNASLSSKHGYARLRDEPSSEDPDATERST